MNPLSDELKEAFLALICALSPENISCDGECPREERRAKYAAIQRSWNKLEHQAGRKVTEDEINKLAAAELEELYREQDSKYQRSFAHSSPARERNLTEPEGP